jgi:hypothetical protein
MLLLNTAPVRVLQVASTDVKTSHYLMLRLNTAPVRVIRVAGTGIETPVLVRISLEVMKVLLRSIVSVQGDPDLNCDEAKSALVRSW